MKFKSQKQKGLLAGTAVQLAEEAGGAQMSDQHSHLACGCLDTLKEIRRDISLHGRNWDPSLMYSLYYLIIFKKVYIKK